MSKLKLPAGKFKNNGNTFSHPVRKREPEKLIDYGPASTPNGAIPLPFDHKPNKVKLNVDFGEDRFPPESKPSNDSKSAGPKNTKRTEKSLMNLSKDNAMSNRWHKHGKKR